MSAFVKEDGKGLVEWSVKGLHGSLLPRLQKLAGSRSAVLDAGCGSGAWLDRLAKAGFRDLTGFDSDVGQVRTNAARFLRVDLNEPDDWPVPASSFDIITAIEVIEHLTNIGHFLDQASRAMKPGGALLVTTPNIGSIAARIRFLFLDDMKQFGCKGDRTHLFPVVLGTFERVLDRSGLRLMEAWGFPAGGRTLSSRGAVNALASAARLFLPERIPGDNLCMLIRHREGE